MNVAFKLLIIVQTFNLLRKKAVTLRLCLRQNIEQFLMTIFDAISISEHNTIKTQLYSNHVASNRLMPYLLCQTKMKDLLFQTLRIVSFMIGIKIKVSFKCAFSKEYKNADFLISLFCFVTFCFEP